MLQTMEFRILLKVALTVLVVFIKEKDTLFMSVFVFGRVCKFLETFWQHC